MLNGYLFDASLQFLTLYFNDLTLYISLRNNTYSILSKGVSKVSLFFNSFIHCPIPSRMALDIALWGLCLLPGGLDNGERELWVYQPQL